MKTILALFLTCFACALFGQAPPIQRNPFTTNDTANAISKVVLFSSTNSHIINVPFDGVQNERTPLNTTTNYYRGQWAITYGGIGGFEPYINVSKGVGFGQTNYGKSINIPGNIGTIGANAPTGDYPHNVYWFLNDNPNAATMTNLLASTDTSWKFHNRNPYAFSCISISTVTTNIQYAQLPALFTNAEGHAIYRYQEDFGPTLGVVSPDSPFGEVLQAGDHQLLLGGAGFTGNFHIAPNIGYPGDVGIWQHPFFTIQLAGITNSAQPLVVGFPILVPNTAQPTNANWKWGLVHDARTGETWQTNSTQYIRAVQSRGTNVGAHIFGGGPGVGNQDNTAVNNFNGTASFSAPDYTGYNTVWTFDAVGTHRGGFGIQGGFNGAKYITAAGAPYILAFSSGSDLMTGIGSQIWTNYFVADSVTRRAYYSNLVSVSVIGGNVGIGTATPVGALDVAGEIRGTNIINRAKGSWWATAGGSTNAQWRMVKNGVLTNVVDVSSATWNPLTHTFWTIHNNNNGRLTEWNLDGVFQRKLDWSASQISDGEGITWMGGDRFAVVDEDNNRIVVFSITNNASGGTLNTNNATIIQAAASIGVDPPSGIEEVAWDPDRNGWWSAKEKSPAQLLFLSADGATTNNYFTTAQMQTFTNANHTDFTGLALDRENQVLAVSQDEGGAGQFDRVILIDLINSNLLAVIDMTNMGQMEGVTWIGDGRLLVTGEANQFAVYEVFNGGLNTGMGFVPNTSTNLPWTPIWPYGGEFGTGGNLVASNHVATGVFAASTNGITFPKVAVSASASLSFAGAQILSDGTNLIAVFQNAGGARTTNKLVTAAWP